MRLVLIVSAGDKSGAGIFNYSTAKNSLRRRSADHLIQERIIYVLAGVKKIYRHRKGQLNSLIDLVRFGKYSQLGGLFPLQDNLNKDIENGFQMFCTENSFSYKICT